jgi:hypothetical protein
MKYVLSLLLTTILLAVPVLAEGADKPDQNVFRLDKACRSGDLKTARAQFTAGCWSREWDSGENFCGQARRKSFQLIVAGTKQAGERALVTVNIQIQGKLVDQVYMYFVRERGKWLIASIDENRHFGAYFLSKKLGPDFKASKLPSSAELDEIGKLLLQASLDSSKNFKLEAKVTSKNLADYLDRIAKLSDASFASSHYEKSLGCGALKFEGSSQTPGYKEKLFIHLVHKAGNYQVTNYSYGWLGNSRFLTSCQDK